MHYCMTRSQLVFTFQVSDSLARALARLIGHPVSLIVHIAQAEYWNQARPLRVRPTPHTVNLQATTLT
jgi:hypothetical protein